MDALPWLLAGLEGWWVGLLLWRVRALEKELAAKAELAAKTHHALQQFTRLCACRHIDRPKGREGPG